MKTIALGTTSKHKIEATERALVREGLPWSVRPVKTQSGVPEQPFGLDETRRGATTRAREALAKVEGAHEGLGIESGIVDLGDAYVDVAVAARVRPDRPTIYTMSAGLPFPTEYVRRSAESGQAVTAGKFMAEAAKARGEEMDDTDPHAYLTHGRVRRNQLLEDAIVLNLALGR